MGYEYVEITEHWVAFPGGGGVRRDLMGFADLLAIGPSGVAFAVQVTSWGNIAARRKKILASPVAKLWASGPNEILLLGYRKNKSGRYERKEEWVGW
jgi:hypothetical protein